MLQIETTRENQVESLKCISFSRIAHTRMKPNSFFQANNGRHCSVATSAPPASIRSTARNPNPNSSFSNRVIIAEISYGYRNARMAMEYFILYS